MAEPAVKPEPMDASPGDVPGAPPPDEDDMYEDAGDLEFYDKSAEGNRFEALYLARLPKYLWESWAKLVEGLNDDDEVRLGTLRTWQSKDSNGEDVGAAFLHGKQRQYANSFCRRRIFACFSSRTPPTNPCLWNMKWMSPIRRFRTTSSSLKKICQASRKRARHAQRLQHRACRHPC